MKLEREIYEPYIKTSCLSQLTRVFPFRILRDDYAPLMRLIMKYFSCEGRFSRLYAYHVRLLMHFTRVCMMNLPFFICGNIERMRKFMQHKTPRQQLNSVYHFALIQIMVDHQLGLQGITWEDYVTGPLALKSMTASEKSTGDWWRCVTMFFKDQTDEFLGSNHKK